MHAWQICFFHTRKKKPKAHRHNARKPRQKPAISLPASKTGKNRHSLPDNSPTEETPANGLARLLRKVAVQPERGSHSDKPRSKPKSNHPSKPSPSRLKPSRPRVKPIKNKPDRATGAGHQRPSRTLLKPATQRPPNQPSKPRLLHRQLLVKSMETSNLRRRKAPAAEAVAEDVHLTRQVVQSHALSRLIRKLQRQKPAMLQSKLLQTTSQRQKENPGNRQRTRPRNMFSQYQAPQNRMPPGL